MNANELYTLLNDLPDDYVTAAAGTHTQSRRPLYLIVPALAACITLLIAAAIYPKLRTQQPERQDPAYTAQTTAPVTTETPEKEPPAETVTGTAEQTAPHTTKKQTANTTAVTVNTEAASVTQAQPGTTAAPQQDAPAQKQTEPPAVTTVTKRIFPASATELPQTVTTAENVCGEDPYGWPEHTVPTIPYQMKREYAVIPQEPGDPPIDVPVIIPVMTADVTQATTAVPADQGSQTTVVVTMPPPEEEPPQPSVRFDGRYWCVNPMKPCENMILLSGILEPDGTLLLNLLCLTGDPAGNETVQLSLTLPPEITEVITGTRVQLTETDSAAVFADAEVRAPVIYDRMKKEDKP